MKYTISIMLFISLIFSSAVMSLTGDEAFKKIKARFAGIETMKGKLTISYQSGEIYSGDFKFMPPGKIYLKFSDPPGKVIVSNGKKLWTYDSATEVCGVQKLQTEEEEDDRVSKGEKNKKPVTRKKSTEKKPKLIGGIDRFFWGYDVTILSEDASSCIIELQNEKRKYSDIKLVLDSTFLVKNAIFINEKGNGFLIKFFDIKTGEKITPGLFNFNVPANAQVVKNPLDIR